MRYVNDKNEEMLLTIRIKKLGSWRWAKNRICGRIITRPIGQKGSDLRFKGVKVIAQTSDYCTDYAGGKYGFNNGFTYSDLAHYAKLYGFRVTKD